MYYPSVRRDGEARRGEQRRCSWRPNPPAHPPTRRPVSHPPTHPHTLSLTYIPIYTHPHTYIPPINLSTLSTPLTHPRTYSLIRTPIDTNTPTNTPVPWLARLPTHPLTHTYTYQPVHPFAHPLTHPLSHPPTNPHTRLAALPPTCSQCLRHTPRRRSLVSLDSSPVWHLFIQSTQNTDIEESCVSA